jgi:poly(hydroxyalkanoate) granule-associated protein
MSRTNPRSTTPKSLDELRKLAVAKVTEARAKAGEVTTSLEKVFEQRVSRAISRLGVPSAKEVRGLAREVARLKASVERLRRARA